LIQLILLAAILMAAFGALHWFLNAAPNPASRKYRRNLIWFGLGLFLILAATGRLGLVLPLIGGTIAMAIRLSPLLIQLALQNGSSLHRLRQKHRDKRQAAADNAASCSTVESRFLRMQLDHATGAIAGEVLAGTFAGRQLQDLTPEQLLRLYDECLRNDEESATLLNAYLERVYGENWQHISEGRSRGFDSGGKLTEEEAYHVLGLAPGCSRNEIIEAHRRLMQRLHPDRGGSDYLAAKINQAKDILLRR
jgi:hypothetical protein